MRKLRMVVCDHNGYDREFYAAFCRKLGEKHQIDIELKTYDSSRILLFDMEDPDFSGMIDILFIETEMPELSGIDFTQRVRNMNFRGPVILLTHSTWYYEAAFDVKAFNYVRKGESHLDRFENVFLGAVEAAAQTSMEYIVLYCAGEYRQVGITNIKYFEVRDHIIDIHYKNGHFEFISTLNKIEAQLVGRGFQRIHRSYLVSLDYIQKASFYNVTLHDDTVLPVGRTYSQSLKSAMEEWRQT